MRIALCLIAMAMAVAWPFHAGASSATPINVLIWDEYFKFDDPALEPILKSSQRGEIFSWREGAAPVVKARHGLYAAYVVAKNRPEVRIHVAHGPPLPWQDPEVCALVDDPEWTRELAKHGYPPLPNCRAQAEAAIHRLGEFIAKNQIRIVNVSHGTYFDRYVSRNPDLLAAKYPEVDRDAIQKFLYRNFLAIGDVAQALFRDNPNTLFIAAAGNYADDVDRDLPMKWDEETPHWYPVPTHYGSLGDRFDNLIVVAATYDGVKLSDGTNYGKTKVSFAKMVGVTKVPDEAGEMVVFGGTSEAAAQTTRLMAQAISVAKTPLTPKQLKELAHRSVTQRPRMMDSLIAGGVLFDETFLNAVDSTTVRVPAIEESGRFKQFTIPEAVNPRNYGCHSLDIDQNGILWMTMPWANRFLSFNPETGEFKDYELPTPESRPDGITVDREGQVWAGVDPNGGFVKFDPSTERFTEFHHPKLSTLNITHSDRDGRVWASGHRAQTIAMIDPISQIIKEWRVRMDWPLDMRIDADGSAWVTGLKGFAKPWGQGALIRASAESEELEYFPLPERDERLQAYWLAPAGGSIVVSLMRDGWIDFDKVTHKMTQYQRTDGLHVYNIIRTHPDGTVVMTNSHEQLKSLDIFDPRNPTAAIRSFKLPNQDGEPREALAFDKNLDVWYCQTFTNILGKLEFKKTGG